MMLRVNGGRLWRAVGMAAVLLCAGAARAGAQASAIPSAQAAPVSDESAKGHKVLEQMVQALGGEAWLNRTNERVEGKGATFYKGNPNPYETQFEEYLRFQPFGERVVIVSKMGVLIPTSKRDVAEVWTEDNGYEVTFRGRKALLKPDVEDFQRRRKHAIEVVVRDWLKRPGTLVTYEGSSMDDRRLVDKVSIITADNDAVTLGIDQESHLPRSREFQWRDPVYKDMDTDVERYDDWHRIDGIMTALTITRYQNGDMAGQRFLTKVQYNLTLDPDLFDPDRPLNAKK